MRILDVAEVTAYLKDLLDSDPILGDVWVRGEITNFSRSAAGHIYFSLRSANTQIRCVMFRGNARWLTFQPDNGNAVLAHGNVSLYEASGQYQLYVDLIQPEGTGLWQLQFEQLRRKLEMEGLFELSRKRPLPPYPGCIGVVTSASGAVWHDIQNVLGRRYPLCELILAPAQVQGTEAPDSIVRALSALQADGRAEVIIVARGGGSMEDLACFNDERVARAVFASTVPVISAVGHETDVTICDMVADLRAPTPSAAAELVAPHLGELRAAVLDLLGRAEVATLDALRRERDVLAQRTARLRHHSPDMSLRQERLRLDTVLAHMSQGMTTRLARERAAIDAARTELDLLHPVRIMRRGYAMVLDDATGARVRDVAALRLGQAVAVQFHDGQAKATVGSLDPSQKGVSRARTAP